MDSAYYRDMEYLGTADFQVPYCVDCGGVCRFPDSEHPEDRPGGAEPYNLPR